MKRIEIPCVGLLFAAVCIFVVDTVTTVDIVVAVLYVAVVLLSIDCRGRSSVLVAGWGSIFLTILSFAITADYHALIGVAFFNCVLSVMAIACVTVLSLRNIRAQADLRRNRDEIARVARGISMKEVTASIVHEVAQPMAAIGVNAGAACRWLDHSPPDFDESRAATQRILVEVDRASAVINQLRGLISGEPITISSCNLAALIDEAIDHLHLEIDEAGVDVTMTCPGSLEIEADYVLVQQVIINTLANAVDALAEAGGVRAIAIEAKAVESDVIIVVQDTGVGLDDEALGRIFEPFFTTKPSGRGMGIGLSVSRSIVHAHGGTIGVRRNADRGLAIEIRLPSDAEGRGH